MFSKEIIQAVMIAFSNGIGIEDISELYGIDEKDVNEIVDRYVDLFLWEE